MKCMTVDLFLTVHPQITTLIYTRNRTEAHFEVTFGFKCQILKRMRALKHKKIIYHYDLPTS